MKLTIKLTILTLALLTIAVGCEEGDKFSSDSSLQLEFSRDVVGFDTVFTTLVSPIQQLKIYNRNNNSIAFESIELVNADKSGFRINVDGQGGTKFDDVDILRKDSIYIMIDAKLNETKDSNILVRDSIRIKWNGNTKYIQLGAYGLNVHIWDDNIIDANTNLTAERGYYIRGNVTVSEGATLHISEGTTFYFDRKGALTVNGRIVAQGTTDKPITFRGHRFDMIEKSIPYDNASDQWKGITIGGNSYNNSLQNVRIRNSQKGIDFLASQPTIKKMTLLNTVVHNTSLLGLRAINCDIDATNSLFSNSKGAVAELIGGKYSFNHCTIANYYEWHNRTSASVILTDRVSAQKYPLLKADFTNSIIVGTRRNEIAASTEDTPKYRFHNCVIQASAPSDSPAFTGKTLWNIDSPFLFKELNPKGRFNYSFELAENSPAIDAADPAFTTVGYDIRGIARPSGNKPDIGCYEWTY